MKAASYRVQDHRAAQLFYRWLMCGALFIAVISWLYTEKLTVGVDHSRQHEWSLLCSLNAKDL
jgi:hypothetical protein